MLQCVAACCSVLQCVAVCCNVFLLDSLFNFTGSACALSLVCVAGCLAGCVAACVAACVAVCVAMYVAALSLVFDAGG